MPTEQLTPLHLIDEPNDPMRKESLLPGLGELIESIAANGLIQPIAIRLRPEGRYYVIAGHRRYLAHQEMGRREIRASVYLPEEGSDDEIRGAENIIRNAVNPVEEAEFYRAQMVKHGISVAEVARRYQRSASTVAKALAVLDGDPRVLAALRDEAINRAQAEEINKVKDEIGRTVAIENACHNGFTSASIKVWRENRERTGISASMEQVRQVIQDQGPPTNIVSLYCMFCKQYHEMSQVTMWQVCNDCQGLIARGVELLTASGENA